MRDLGTILVGPAFQYLIVMYRTIGAVMNVMNQIKSGTTAKAKAILSQTMRLFWSFDAPPLFAGPRSMRDRVFSLRIPRDTDRTENVRSFHMKQRHVCPDDGSSWLRSPGGPLHPSLPEGSLEYRPGRGINRAHVGTSDRR